MNTLITVLHVMAAFCLILTVLLQAGKGAAMGSGLGAGSSQTMFCLLYTSDAADE